MWPLKQHPSRALGVGLSVSVVWVWVGVGVRVGVGVGVGVGVVWVRVGVGWVVCGCVGVGAQGYVIDARRLARQQFRLGRNSSQAWRSARQCQGMLPRTAPRPSFSLINFLPRTVPPGVSPLLAASFLKVFSTLMRGDPLEFDPTAIMPNGAPGY